jgi:hypothetical protein
MLIEGIGIIRLRRPQTEDQNANELAEALDSGTVLPYGKRLSLRSAQRGMIMTDNPPPGLPPELVKLGLQLEQIFWPHAKRQRDEACRRQASPGLDPETQELKFVHYTSAEAALSIIRSKRIWMRNTTCMADYREVQHGFEILNRFFADKPKMDAFIAALDACVPGVAQESIDLFNRWWNDIRFNTFITSISEHDPSEDLHGRLSMWRAFGLSAARVAIVFRVPRVSAGVVALRLIFSPVAYLTEEEAHGVLTEVMRNCGTSREFLTSIDRKLLVETVFVMLLAGVTSLKHEGFREEREWRAIYCPGFYSSPLMESQIEVVTGVPQRVFKIPLDVTASPELADLDFSRIFHRLIIGPSPYPWPMFEAFREVLTQVGVGDAGDRVWTSNIPIRTA